MFKIKENVKLEKLEKFGFKKNNRDEYVYIESKPEKNWCNETINNLIGVKTVGQWEGMLQPYYVEAGTILFSSYSFDGRNAMKTLYKLYDLIKAGLVEKEEGLR